MLVKAGGLWSMAHGSLLFVHHFVATRQEMGYVPSVPGFPDTVATVSPVSYIPHQNSISGISQEV